MKTFTDQMGRTVSINWPPTRIISLVPSQTELLATLGLDEEVVGITKFCIHPENWFRSKKRVGGTKDADINKIAELQPDLIIGNKEENKEEQIKDLMLRYPVWMSDIHNLEDAMDMIKSVGKLVNKKEAADELASSISNNFRKLLSGGFFFRRVAYFIWKNPYMTVGKQSFINSMLEACDFINVFDNVEGEYPEITREQLAKANPEVIFLSSEPFPFNEKHINEFRQICPDAKIVLVDGEYFSWYGSRLLGAPEYLNKVIKQLENA
ncbi:MAG TPA: helical backbone metal receptor [Bacteroidia bacterium]|nr:helical backbone metal receptor [Bacteroidia bacterium]